MGYKKRITKSVVLDSASPNSALDVMIDWIVNKFITDVPDLKIQKEIAYSADGYRLGAAVLENCFCRQAFELGRAVHFLLHAWQQILFRYLRSSVI